MGWVAGVWEVKLLRYGIEKRDFDKRGMGLVYLMDHLVIKVKGNRLAWQK